MKKTVIWLLYKDGVFAGLTQVKAHAEKRKSEGYRVEEQTPKKKAKKPKGGPDEYHRQSSGRFAGGKLDRELAALKDWDKKL